MSKGRDSQPHIGIFGRRNYGKSSLINFIINQDVAIVSSIAGTTTDPVKKSIEIHGIGPVVIIDTAGIDDVGELGQKRVDKTYEVLKIIDLAILVINKNLFADPEKKLIAKFQEYSVPFIIIHNKSDIDQIFESLKNSIQVSYNTRVIDICTFNKNNLEPLIQLIKQSIPENAYCSKSIVGDLIGYGDVVLLITPIDIEAPEGRLILPQVQVIRDVLDNDGIAIVIKEREADVYIRKMSPQPKLVVTDSQVFLKADAIVPSNIPLTSFSILLARQKGDFEHYLKGTSHIAKLNDGDRLLILESCTHHVACDDIGRIKIPRWISNFTGKSLDYDVVSGLNKLPRPINDYAMVIQCGGCVLTRKQILNRLKPAVDSGVPVTNYGLAISYVQGIYNRAISPFLMNQDNVNKNEYL